MKKQETNKCRDSLGLCIKFDELLIVITISEVKWVGVYESSYLAGCEFCCLTNKDRQYMSLIINEFIF